MTAAEGSSAVRRPDVAAVVALKATEQAKSRLALVDPLRRRLAWTMAVDTLSALAGAVEHVLVVSDQPSLASRLGRLGLAIEVVAEADRTGMNAALTHGARRLHAAGFATVLACVGDLPALRPESVATVLELAGPHPRSVVTDASGVGTTMLIANGVPLDPRFQGRSAAAHHSSGAVGLSGPSIPGARRDVDTEVDLADALRLGVGAATARLVDPATSRLAGYQVVTATQWRDDEGVRLAVTSTGHRVALPTAALSDGLREVRLGQRLHAVVAGGRVLSAWL